MKNVFDGAGDLPELGKDTPKSARKRRSSLFRGVGNAMGAMHHGALDPKKSFEWLATTESRNALAWALWWEYKKEDVKDQLLNPAVTPPEWIQDIVTQTAAIIQKFRHVYLSSEIVYWHVYKGRHLADSLLWDVALTNVGVFPCAPDACVNRLPQGPAGQDDTLDALYCHHDHAAARQGVDAGERAGVSCPALFKYILKLILLYIEALIPGYRSIYMYTYYIFSTPIHDKIYNI